jgi:hypothetical protein
MTIPNYLQTLKRAIRELEEKAARERGQYEINEKSPTLISLNSLISHPRPSENLENIDRISRTEIEEAKIASKGGLPFAEALGDALSGSQARTREKSEISGNKG